MKPTTIRFDHIKSLGATFVPFLQTAAQSQELKLITLWSRKKRHTMSPSLIFSVRTRSKLVRHDQKSLETFEYGSEESFDTKFWVLLSWLTTCSRKLCSPNFRILLVVRETVRLFQPQGERNVAFNRRWQYIQSQRRSHTTHALPDTRTHAHTPSFPSAARSPEHMGVTFCRFLSPHSPSPAIHLPLKGIALRKTCWKGAILSHLTPVPHLPALRLISLNLPFYFCHTKITK